MKYPFHVGRYRLITLLLSISVMCVCLGWYATAVKRQRSAIVRLRSVGGEIRYDFEMDETGSLRGGTTPPQLPRWHQLLGVDYVATPVWGCVVGTDAKDLTPLGEFSELRWLELHRLQVDTLLPIAKLENLTSLGVQECQIGDLSCLTSLTRLEELDLSHTNIHTLPNLASLQQLETLVLTGTDIHDLRPLRRLYNLRHLYLDRTDVRDVLDLTQMLNLRTLDLQDTSIVDISPLAHLRNLRCVNLIGTKASDLSPLTNLSHLTDLYLGRESPKHESYVAQMVNPSSLVLRDSEEAWNQEVARLKCALPNCRIHHMQL